MFLLGVTTELPCHPDNATLINNSKIVVFLIVIIKCVEYVSIFLYHFVIYNHTLNYPNACL